MTCQCARIAGAYAVSVHPETRVCCRVRPVHAPHTARGQSGGSAHAPRTSDVAVSPLRLAHTIPGRAGRVSIHKETS